MDCGRRQEKEKIPFENKNTSHGLCSECSVERELSELKNDHREWLKENIKGEIINGVKWVDLPNWDAKISDAAKNLYQELRSEVEREESIGLKR
jgi:hypothetical protein